MTRIRGHGIAALVGGLMWSFTQPGLAQDRKHVVAASEARHQVDLKRLPCLAMVAHGASIYGKSYFGDSRVDQILKDLLPETIVQRNTDDCSRALFFNVVARETRAVKFRGSPSVLLMSFQVCGTEAGRISDKTCTDKNLYLFKKGLAPFEAFEVGARAFLKDQDKEWAMMTIAVQSKVPQ